MSRSNSRKIASIPTVADLQGSVPHEAMTEAMESFEMRPRLSAPVSLAVRGYSDLVGVPVTAVINLAIADYLQSRGFVIK